MKVKLVLIFLWITTYSFSQENEKVTTIDFVEILNDNRDETIFYYENNWKALREQALERGYIDSFQILETPTSEEAPFNLILTTTYSNNEQYQSREEHFALLIKEMDGLKLLNDKKPNEFRKNLYNKENVRHLY